MSVKRRDLVTTLAEQFCLYVHVCMYHVGLCVDVLVPECVWVGCVCNCACMCGCACICAYVCMAWSVCLHMIIIALKGGLKCLNNLCHNMKT